MQRQEAITLIILSLGNMAGGNPVGVLPLKFSRGHIQRSIFRLNLTSTKIKTSFTLQNRQMYGKFQKLIC